ncbi:MAG: hypothetical protein Cons2KO_33930 [Congregibacter sp.]
MGLGLDLAEKRSELLSSGVSDAKLTEAIAHASLNFFTNSLNKTFQPDVDFPLTK